MRVTARSARFLPAGLSVILLLSGCAQKRTAGSGAGSVVSVSAVTGVLPRAPKAANFSWKDESGATADLDGYRGRVTVVNFWATWCPPCRAELPALVSLSKEMAGRGVRFIGVSVDRGANVASDLREFAGSNGITYPIVISIPALEEAYGSIRAIPTTFILDSTGTVVKTFVGSRTKEVFAEAIESALR